MAMLESTPYRVYYLINCPWNTYENRRLWDYKRSKEGDLGVYTRIKAVMTKPNDFSSVIVKATGVSEVDCIIGENVTDYEDMPWYDISEDFIRIINNYYDREDNKGKRDQQIRYADRIEKLLTEHDSFKLTLDSRGFPRVEIRGLPYLNSDNALDETRVIIELNDEGTDYKYTISTGKDSIIKTTGYKLHNILGLYNKLIDIIHSIDY